MSEAEKVNGDVTTDNAVKTSQIAQRRPRLNRRGLYLLNHPLTNLCSEISVRQNSDINGSNEGSESKKKPDSSQRKIISLASVQNATSEKIPVKGKTTTIVLKKSSCSSSKRESTENTGISSSSDPPPKKKHKPITWP